MRHAVQFKIKFYRWSFLALKFDIFNGKNKKFPERKIHSSSENDIKTKKNLQ